MKRSLETHYATLWELTDAVMSYYGVTMETITGGISYEETQQFDIEMQGGRWLHVIIYRTCGGRYELVSYIL